MKRLMSVMWIAASAYAACPMGTTHIVDTLLQADGATAMLGTIAVRGPSAPGRSVTTMTVTIGSGGTVDFCLAGGPGWKYDATFSLVDATGRKIDQFTERWIVPSTAAALTRRQLWGGSSAPEFLVSPQQINPAGLSPGQQWVWDGAGWVAQSGNMVYPGAGVGVSTGSGWATSLTAPASGLVGLTDTQTLTNKTVDGVSPATMAYLDATSSVQSQLNGKEPGLSNPGTSGWLLSSTAGGTRSWVAPPNSMIYPGPGLAASTGSAWGTSLTAPAGTIVGTTDTQTLTNKTVNGVSPATMAFVDPTSSIQTQLNAKQATLSNYLTISGLTGYPASFAPTASAVRGDGLFAVGATPTWQRLAHPTVTGGYYKWNGTDIVASTMAAAGPGSCTNGVQVGDNADAAPTCTTADTTTTHALFATASAPAFRAIVAGDIPTLNQNTTGTAAALTGTPTLCSAGNYPLGILANGNATGCTLASGGGGTVTSVSFTGGLVSVATPTATPAFTVAGTSGGIPYFSGASTWASSGALAANGVVLGGGAGVAPTVTTADSTTTHALFATAGAPAFRALAATDIPAALSSTTSVNGTSIPASVTLLQSNAANTAGASFTLDMSSASALTGHKLPSAAGAVPTVAAQLSYDSTTNAPVYGNGTVTKTVVGAATSTTATQALFATATAGAPAYRAIAVGDIPTLNQSTSGNAATATALAALPTACSAGNYPLGILANGNATSCTAVPVASSTTPVMDGTAAIGSGTTWAKADHVHPTDTSRAPTASPTFTGTVDSHGATKTLPHRTGTGTPVARDACATIGETYFQTDAGAGLNTFACTATGTPGTWTMQGGGGVAPFTCSVATGDGTSKTCTHNLGIWTPWVSCYDSSNYLLGSIGSASSITAIQSTSVNTSVLTLTGAVNATCIFSTGSQGPTGATGSTGASGAIAQIQAGGSNLTVRGTLNFAGTGIACVDNSGAARTDCTVSSGGGGGATVGLYSALGSAGASGAIYRCTDCRYDFFSNGASWLAFDGSQPVKVPGPISGGWTKYGAGTMTDSAGSIVVTAPQNAGVSITAAIKALGTATFTAKIYPITQGYYGMCGLMATDGTNYHLFGVGLINSNTAQAYVNTYSSLTAWSGTANSYAPSTQTGNYYWLRGVVSASKNVTWSRSMDGINWVQFGSLTSLPNNITGVGFGCDSNNASELAAVQLVSFAN